MSSRRQVSSLTKHHLLFLMLPSSSLPEVAQRATLVAMVSVETAADAKGADTAGDEPTKASATAPSAQRGCI